MAARARRAIAAAVALCCFALLPGVSAAAGTAAAENNGSAAAAAGSSAAAAPAGGETAAAAQTGTSPAAAAKAPVLEVEKNLPDACAAVLSACVPDAQVRRPARGAVASLRMGNAACALDVQAQPLLAAGAAVQWTPFAAATVVIAVDRSRCSAQITGWRDLAAVPDTVGFTRHPESRCLVAAMACGLGGDEASLEPAISLLADIRRQGRLQQSDEWMPIQICFDDEAAQRLAAGENLAVIVPREGTLTFVRGLLAPAALALPEDLPQRAAAAGLRGVDGSAQAALYPAASAYASARRVQDMAHVRLLLQQVDAHMRRQVFGLRLYSSADGREHQLFAQLAAALAMVWVASVVRRAMQKGVRRAALAEGALIIGWVLVRTFKYQVSDESVLLRACWYAFAPFELGLALVLLWMAWAIDQPEPMQRTPRWWRACLVLDAALAVLVLTNDLHHLVYCFDLATPGWKGSYTYGPGYYVFLAAVAAQVLCAVGGMAWKARTSPRFAVRAAPLLVCALAALYSAGYARGVRLARESDFTLTVCFLAVLFFEAAMYAGMIPVNSRYRAAFRCSPLSMQITDDSGHTVLASRQAQPLAPALFAQLQMHSPAAETESVLVYGQHITGGMAVWHEDISHLRALQRDIRASAAKLRAANDLLARRRDRQRALETARAQAALQTRLEAETAQKLQRFSQRIAALPQDAPASTAQLAPVALLLCCIKRRCNLFFRQSEAESMPLDELAIYMEELAELAQYGGVRAVVLHRGGAGIPAPQAVLVYDGFYEALAFAEDCGGGALLCQLAQEDACFSVKILLSHGEGTQTFALPAGMADAAASLGGTAAVRALDDGTGVELTFPRGGGAA